MLKPFTAGVALALAVPFGAVAQSTSDAAGRPAPSAPSAAPAPAGSAPPASPAAAGTNPAISLILSGRYARLSRDPGDPAIAGFLQPEGAEAGPGPRGFSLAESELGLSASIDPWWRGFATFALESDGAVEIEEAYVRTTALGQGLSLKAGRFFSGIGYLNPQHAHTWDFVDNPLAYEALLGRQYGDDGVQLTWLAPTDQYLAIGLEIGRGRGFPGGDNDRNGVGMAALTAHTGGDIGTSHNWRAGASLLTTRADGQALQGFDAAGAAVAGTFGGRTRVLVVDGVWKWSPGGNATRTNFKLQGEYLRSTRSGELAVDGAADGESGYRAVQSGWYLQAVYQFMPRWRIGLRTDRLDPGTPEAGPAAAVFAGDGYRARRQTLMLEFNPSEFSRLRLQFAQDRSRPGPADNQVFLQYQMSLGAHGAHGY